MSSKALSIVSILLGIALIVIGCVYWFTPANALPSFFPGHDPNISTIHFKHGLASFLLGLVLFAFAWFKTGKKSTSQQP
jgi:uncharacterized membrane-anchored protein YitT (DUF2179 family)